MDEHPSSKPCKNFELKDFRCIGEDHDVQYRQPAIPEEVQLDIFAERAKRTCNAFEGSDLICLDGSQHRNQAYSQCIPIAEQCNGIENCKGGSDERNCTHGKSILTSS